MKRLLLALGLAFSFVTGAQAQTGTECWPVSQGSIPALCLNQVRNQQANVVTASWPGTSTLGISATATIASGGNYLINAASSGTTVFTLPGNPLPDGTVVGVCNATGTAWSVNATTIIANTNQTLVGTPITITTLAAGNCARVQWNLSNATWYRVQ